MRFLFSLGLVFIINFTAQAQAQQAVINYNPKVAKAAKEWKKKTIRSRNLKGAELPFFDDFAYPGPFPDEELWMENLVFINNTLGFNPISVGVATFDALDNTGSPYGGGFGSSDTLTSIPLDLSGDNPKFLSYYVQPKGLGDAPGIIDRLILEFKNIDGDWEEVNSHEVGFEDPIFPLDSFPPFEFVQPIVIEDPVFLYEDFQFRFRNLSSRSGGDIWHIDYVRLEDTEITQNNEDLAFTTLPSNILRDYSSVPWLHVQSEIDNDISLILESMDIEVFNHDNNQIGTTESEFEVNGIDDAVLLFRRQSLLNQSNNLQSNISSGRNNLYSSTSKLQF